VAILLLPFLADNSVADVPLHVGGTGGVYFLAEPGQLVIELEKRDLNRSGRRADLRAILVGPDRRVIEENTLPDDGQPRGSGRGPVQSATLTTQVERKGVYGLNITVSNDRYGNEVAWGFQSNCPHYLIETARGHVDRRREERLVFLDADRPRGICFRPRAGEFGIEIRRFATSAPPPKLFYSHDMEVATLDVAADGHAACQVPADPQRSQSPWRLHLPQGQAEVHIDGVTRWDNNDTYPDLPLWTPDRKSWFPLLENRWLITPYQRTAYGEPAAEGKIAFRVHNNAATQQTVRLAVEFPGEPWDAYLAQEEVTLAAKQAQHVTLHYTLPDTGKRTLHIRATPQANSTFSTYATLQVKTGRPPAADRLEIPLILKPYEHENEQLGYLPQYPVDNQVYFDAKNRPFVCTGDGVVTVRDGDWAKTSFRKGISSADADLAGQAYRTASTKVAFDGGNGVYLLGFGGRRAALLYSGDGGQSFAAAPIPGRETSPRTFDLEQFSGHNGNDGPPPIVRFTRTATDPRHRWRRINDLELFVFAWDGDRLLGQPPILLSKMAIGLSVHSGIPSSIVSRGDKIHVAWAEATDPEEDVPGVPTYVATYDRRAKVLSKPVLVGYGAPPNDIHNTPSITMDSQGHLHVLVGTHGQPFQYARSLKPNDTSSGWTEPTSTGGDWRQTYIGFVCDQHDTLHLVSRVWQYGQPPHEAGHHATLAHQQMPRHGSWAAPRVLVVPPFSEYSIFYHRLTIDRTARLFLSYDCWSTYWFYRTDWPGDRRALMFSDDGGVRWKLAESPDLGR